MTNDDFQAELDKNEAEKKSQDKDSAATQSLEQAKKEVVAAVVASTRANMKHREDTTTKVEVQNDLAETDDINRAVEAINNVAVLLLAQGQQKPSVNMIDGTDLGERFNELGKTLTDLLTEVKNDTKQDENMQTVTKQLDTFLKQLKTLQVAPDPDLKKSLANVEKALQKLDMKPTVNVPAPKVTVQGTEVDLSPLTELLDKIATTLASLPTEKDDNTDVIAAIQGVNDAIHGLTFPVPNYVLPFKDINGRAVQVQLDASGNVPTTGGAGGGGTQYAELATTSPATGTVALGRYKSSAPTLTDGQLYAAQLDASGNLKVNVAAGGASGGTSSSFGSAFPATGTAVGATDGTNMQALKVDASNNLLTKVNVALPAGTNVIGHVITDSGSTTAVTQATAANLNATVVGTGTFVVQATEADGANTTLGSKADAKSTATDTTAVTMMQVLKEISFMEQNPASRAVTNAGTFAVQATLAAETTKVIGTVRTADGSGNLYTTNSTTYTAKFGQDTNLLGTLGTAFSTAGKVDVKGADGDVFVRQATASNLNATVVQGTAAAVTAGWPVINGQQADTTGTFTNATQTTSVTASSLNGYETVTVSINGTYGTATGVFEVSDDGGTTWYGVMLSRSDSATTETGYTSLTNTNRMWSGSINGGDQFRVRSTAVASGTVNVRISPSSGDTADSATVQLGSALPTGANTIGALTANQSVNVAQINGVATTMGNGVSGTGVQRVTIASDSTGQIALAAGSALVGKVGIDQTTPGTTNAVVDTPVTSGGLSIVTGSVGATATVIKGSAGQLYGYHLFNTTAAVAYVQIFNVAAASVTLGTTAPTISIGIPASGGVTVHMDKGIAFGTAISYACTTTRTGSSGATCDVNFFYK